MDSSDAEQNGNPDQRFQRRAGHRSAYYELLLQKAEARREIEKASNRARRWFAVRIALAAMLGCGVGLFCMAWALHTTDQELAGLAWTIGPFVGYGLAILVLAYGAIKWEKDEW